VTVWISLLVLVRVPDIELPLPLTSPVTLVLSTTVQLYVVPDGTMVVGGLFVGCTLKVFPEQIVAVWFGIKGYGLTTIVLTIESIPQLFPTKSFIW
jgi:hypothetical protein